MAGAGKKEQGEGTPVLVWYALAGPIGNAGAVPAPLGRSVRWDGPDSTSPPFGAPRMPRPVRRLLALASLALPILAAGHVAGQHGAAEPKVSLLGWEDVGTLVDPSRIVAPHFRLVARVEWAPGLPGDPDRYRTVVD